MTLDPLRRIIEAKRKKGIEFDITAEINGFVSRQQCTPDEAKQLRREYGLAVSAVPATSDVPAGSETCPVLLIDWGMDLKPGTHLTPEFTILGLDTQDTPLVYFPLDNWIQCEGWNPTPQLLCTHHGWQFYQPLRLHEPGQYLLQITLIDPTPGQTEPGCYRCRFRVTVPDPDSGRRKKSLKITAEDLVGDFSNVLENFDDVNIDYKGGVIKADKSLFADKIKQVLQPDQSADKPNESRHLTTLNFFPDKQLASKIPYVNICNPETFLSQATLCIENHPAIHLVSGDALTFGRNDPHKNYSNDIPLEIFPLSGNDETEIAAFSLLNRLFSRDHAMLEVTDHDVMLFDRRMKSGMSGGTMLDDQPLAKSQRVRIFSLDTETGKSQAILFSKMLALQVTSYREVVTMDGCRELPESLLSQLYGDNLSQARPVSAVKVAREKWLKQGDHAKDLMDVLQKSLKEMPSSVSQWFTRWLGDQKYRDSRFEQEEHLLVVTSATLGGGRGQAMTIPGRDWLGVQVRIQNFDEMLYLENMVESLQLVAVVNGTDTVLKPLRPIPILPGMVVRTMTSDLFRIE